VTAHIAQVHGQDLESRGLAPPMSGGSACAVWKRGHILVGARPCVKSQSRLPSAAPFALRASAAALNAAVDSHGSRPRVERMHLHAYGDPTAQTCHFEPDLLARTRVVHSGVPD
jgi:hypothetical protein